MCGNYIQRVKIVINNNIIEQVTDFKYLGYRIAEYKSDLFIHSFIYFHSINPYKVIDNLQDIEHVILLMLSRYRKSI